MARTSTRSISRLSPGRSLQGTRSGCCPGCQPSSRRSLTHRPCSSAASASTSSDESSAGDSPLPSPGASAMPMAMSLHGMSSTNARLRRFRTRWPDSLPESAPPTSLAWRSSSARARDWRTGAYSTPRPARTSRAGHARAKVRSMSRRPRGSRLHGIRSGWIFASPCLGPSVHPEARRSSHQRACSSRASTSIWTSSSANGRASQSRSGAAQPHRRQVSRYRRKLRAARGPRPLRQRIPLCRGRAPSSLGGVRRVDCTTPGLGEEVVQQRGRVGCLPPRVDDDDAGAGSSSGPLTGSDGGRRHGRRSPRADRPPHVPRPGPPRRRRSR